MAAWKLVDVRGNGMGHLGVSHAGCHKQGSKTVRPRRGPSGEERRLTLAERLRY